MFWGLPSCRGAGHLLFRNSRRLAVFCPDHTNVQPVLPQLCERSGVGAGGTFDVKVRFQNGAEAVQMGVSPGQVVQIGGVASTAPSQD